jgi:hypothetical protein
MIDRMSQPDEQRPVGVLLGSMLMLLVLAWFAAPVLGFGAMISGAPFLGEQPSQDDRSSAALLATLAGLGGLVAPAVGLLLGIVTRRRQIAVAFAVLETISLGVLVILLVAVVDLS